MNRIELLKEEVVDLFNYKVLNGQVRPLRKIADVQVRLAIPGETIITDVGDEEPETVALAKEGQVVIKNYKTPYGEEQLTKEEKFRSLYFAEGAELSETEWRTFSPRPEKPRYGFVYMGESAYFFAPWGSKMLLNTGDTLASTNLYNTYESWDIYRIKAECRNTTMEIDEEAESAEV